MISMYLDIISLRILSSSATSAVAKEGPAVAIEAPAVVSMEEPAVARELLIVPVRPPSAGPSPSGFISLSFLSHLNASSEFFDSMFDMISMYLDIKSERVLSSFVTALVPVAMGCSTVAMGDSTVAMQDPSVAMEDPSVAKRDSAVAMVDPAVAKGDSVVAVEDSAVAKGDSAVAKGASPVG